MTTAPVKASTLRGTAAATLLAILCVVIVRADTARAEEYGYGACSYSSQVLGDRHVVAGSSAENGGSDAVAHSADDVPDCTTVSSPWVSRSGIFVESVGWAIYCTDDAPYNWNYISTSNYDDVAGAWYASTTGGAEIPAQAFNSNTSTSNTTGSPGDPGKADWYSTIWLSGSFMFEVGCSPDSSASASASPSAAASPDSGAAGRGRGGGTIPERKLVRERALRPHDRIVHRHRCPGGRRLKAALHGVGYFTKNPPKRVRHETKLSTNERRLKVVAKTKGIPRGKVRLQTQIQCGKKRAD